MRESGLRKGKWSLQIASDGTRLLASLLTQRFPPRRPVSGITCVSKDSFPRPGLVAFLRLVLPKVVRVASR